MSELEEAITASNNSSPGPDGVPFKAYRVMCKHAAPVLALVARSLAAGETPLDGFNHGILFLIPKKAPSSPLTTAPSLSPTPTTVLSRKLLLLPSRPLSLPPSMKPKKVSKRDGLLRNMFYT